MVEHLPNPTPEQRSDEQFVELDQLDASLIVEKGTRSNTLVEALGEGEVESRQSPAVNNELSSYQLARVWLAEQCVKLAPELTRPIYTRLVRDKKMQLALVSARAEVDQPGALSLIESLDLQQTEDVLQVAGPFIEEGPAAVLHLIAERNIEDTDLIRTLACSAAKRKPAATLSLWGEFNLVDDESQKQLFDSLLSVAPAVAIQAINEMADVTPALKDEFFFKALPSATGAVLDLISPSAESLNLVLKAFTLNREAVISRLSALPIPQAYKEDLLKETALHEPALVLQVMNTALVPEEPTRKTLALLCSFGDAEATARNISVFSIASKSNQEEVALQLARRSGAAMAEVLPTLQALDTPAITKIVLRCLKSSWWGTVPHLQNLPLPESVRNEVSAESAERDPVRTLQNLAALRPGNAQIHRSIVLNAARKDSQSALDCIGRSAGLPYSLRKEFATHCAEQAPVALAKKLSDLDLQIPVDHDELVETCLRTQFWETLEQIKLFALSDEKRNQILRKASNKDIYRTASIAADLQATDVNELREMVTAYAHSKAPEAAQNNALWATLPEELRIEAASIAAPRNAKAVALGIQNFQIESAEARGEIFGLCLERNVRDTVSVAASFNLPQNILEQFVEPLLRSPDPERDLEIIESLNVPPGSKLYVEAARQAIEASTRRFCDNFPRYGITDPEMVIELSSAAAERNPSALLSNIRKFPLPSENLFEVLVGCSGGNPKRAITLCKKFDISYRGRESELAMACAKHDIERAFKWAESRLAGNNPLANDEVLQDLFLASVHSGRINQSMKVCEQRLKLRSVHPTAQATIELFDTAIASISDADLSDEKASEHLTLIKALRRVQVAPNQSLLRSLRHFNESQKGLLLGFLGQAGPSFGESILETLTSAYPNNAEVSESDVQIVRDVISGGFRGFSADRLQMLRDAYDRSRVSGRRLLEEWSDISRSVLTGVSVSSAIRTSKQYVDYVIEAFRPTSMSRSEVKQYLGSVKDHSRRLARFSYPNDGYAMSLVSIENVSLKDGANLNEDSLAELGRSLQQVADTPVTRRDFFMILTRAAQRASGQVDKIKFLAYLTRHNAASDLGQKLHYISEELVRREYSEKRAYQLLTDLQECLSSTIETALDSVVPALVGSQGDDRDEFFVPSQKHLRTIRSMLDLQLEEPIQTTDIAYALAQELGKVFRKDVQRVAKELNKIDTGAGEAAGDFRMYLSLSQAAFFGRAGAGLCTARDTGSWDDKNYLQMMMVDSGRGRIVGNIQLHLFTNRNGQKSVLARVNPTAQFVSKVDKAILAGEMLRVVRTFAEDNNLIPYLPEQTGWHNLTNRNSYAPSLKAYYGRSESTTVRITRSHSVHTIYRMKDSIAG